MASANSNDHRDGLFIPKGVAYLLGLTMYEQVLKDNNFFLNQVATILVNLYKAWFAIIDPTQTSETKPTSLYEQMLHKRWFLWINLLERTNAFLSL